MDFSQYIEFIINPLDFNLEHILECGQTFRWSKLTDGYLGVVGNEFVKVTQNNNVLKIFNTNDLEKWRRYFDLDRNYSKIKETLSKDKLLSLSIKSGFGIRILQQDIWETMISFIISANNNIKRIEKIIKKLCEKFGKLIGTFNEQNYYSFPEINTMAELQINDLSEIKLGFRDKYILKCAQKIKSENINLDLWLELKTDEVFKILNTFEGIGPKIANCILLFSLSRYEVFPSDVWIKKICLLHYQISPKIIESFAKEKFGKNAGFAQQYLYYHFRNKKQIKSEN